MMNDLLHRLRCWCESEDEEHGIVTEAADEITRLQGVVEGLRKVEQLAFVLAWKDCVRREAPDQAVKLQDLTAHLLRKKAATAAGGDET